jgi:penicillin-insensitive murein endopeptidase
MRAAALLLLAVIAGPAAADAGLPLPAPELSAPPAPLAPPPQIGPDTLAADVFGAATGPSILPAAAIGSYSLGCLTGARALPADGPTFQVMRPSRNRAWAHPALIGFVQDLAAAAPGAGLRGILVGDLSQPLGGPMPYGHTSHQIGLDADIWFTEMPDRRLTPEERDALPFTSTLTPDGALDPAAFTPAFAALVETAARDPRVARIFVHPVLKRALCDRAGADRAWLRVVRPWYGHFEHFHVRLKCPPGSSACRGQASPPAGDGCGAPLDYWFTPAPYAPQPDAEPPAPLTLARMPPLCRRLFGLR